MCQQLSRIERLPPKNMLQHTLLIGKCMVMWQNNRKFNTRLRSSAGQSVRLLSGRPWVRIPPRTPKIPPENPVKSRVSGVFSFLREKRKIVKFTDFHQQILRQLMEIRTNVVRLSGVRLANKNQQDFRYFANENALFANERKNEQNSC